MTNIASSICFKEELYSFFVYKYFNPLIFRTIPQPVHPQGRIAEAPKLEQYSEEYSYYDWESVFTIFLFSEPEQYHSPVFQAYLQVILEQYV